MRGFFDLNQGIPRMICLRPRLMTISSKSSELCGSTMRVQAFQRMVPRRLGVPSTLKAPIGWGSLFKGKLARDKSPRLMKFPVVGIEDMERIMVASCWSSPRENWLMRVTSLEIPALEARFWKLVIYF